MDSRTLFCALGSKVCRSANLWNKPWNIKWQTGGAIVEMDLMGQLIAFPSGFGYSERLPGYAINTLGGK